MSRTAVRGHVSAAEATVTALLLSGILLLLFSPTLPLWSAWTVGGEGDNLLLLANLTWTCQSWSSGIDRLLGGYFYFPTPYSLGLSDPLLALAPLYCSASRALPGNPALPFNLLLFATFPLTALLIHVGLRRGGCSWFPAAVSALAFAICPYRWAQLGHLQVLWMPGLVASVVTLDLLLARPTVRRAALFLLAYAAAAGGGTYLAFWTHLPLATLLVLRWAKSRRRLLARPSRWVLLGALLLALSLAGAAALPHLLAGSSTPMERQESEIRRLGVHAADWFGVSYVNRYAPHFPEALVGRAERSLFPGWLLFLVGVSGIWLSVRRRVRLNLLAQALALAGLLAAALMVDEAHLLASQYVIPLRSMRVPLRAYPLVLLALTWLGARALQALWDAKRGAGRIAVALGAALLLAAESPSPAKLLEHYDRVESRADLSPAWLALGNTEPDASFLALPLRKPSRLEAVRVWRSRLIERPTANGHAGFQPSSFRSLLLECPRDDSPPTIDCVRTAASLGIGWILLESSGAAASVEELRAALARDDREPRIRVALRWESELLLEVVPGPPPTTPDSGPR